VHSLTQENHLTATEHHLPYEMTPAICHR